ncbi:MAG: radical SAM protein [Candidatus Poribacteria bacterium]|nr:radical SAM protein [Candidatus Poribacteria bacterium]
MKLLDDQYQKTLPHEDDRELISLEQIQVSNSQDSGCSSCSSGGCGSPVIQKKTSKGFSGELGEKERDLRRPFVHKFETEKQSYVYDVNTDRIIQVTPAVYDIIDDFGVLSVREMVPKYGVQHTPEEIAEAYETIEMANRDERLFSNNHPSEILYPLDEQSLRLLYDEDVRTLCLGVTEQCNLRCSYCSFSGTYEFHREHNSTFMEFDVARRGIDFFKEHSKLCDYVNLTFYGGEPLLNASLIKQCVEYANGIFGRKPIEYHMTTNATLMNDDICQMWIDNDFKIMVSLDGPKETHDRYRVNGANRGSFNKIKQNLNKLRDKSPDYYRNNVKFSIVLSPPYDFEELNDFFTSEPLTDVRTMRTSSVDTQDTTFFHNFTEEELENKGRKELKEKYFNALIQKEVAHNRPEREHRFMQGLFGDGFEKLIPSMKPTNPFPEVYHPGGICVPGLKTLFLTPEGDFFTCEKSSTSFDLLRLGNLERGLDAAKGIENIENYSHAHDGCRFCYASRHCGTCFIKASAGEQFDGTLKMSNCNNHRSGFHQDLVDIMTVIEGNPDAFDYLKNVTLI